MTGLVIGLVTDVNDPENQGRVKVSYPWLDETLNSPWAPVCSHLAGNDRGFYFMPQVDDEVLVGFPGLPEDDPALALDQSEQMQRLAGLVEALPTEQRAVLLMRAEGDLTLEESAATVGTGRETIKSRLRYALAKLREGLRGP